MVNTKKIALIPTIIFLSKFICSACDTPVFIYAMKNWAPDNYELVVFLNNNPSETEYKYVEIIKSEINRAYLNASLHTTNNIETYKSLFMPDVPELQPPCIALWFYNQLFKEKPVWHSTLNSTSIKLLLDSPVRREIAKNLMNGDMAVWILLESGIAQKDDEAFNTLVNSLTTIRKDINQIYERKKIPFVSKEGSIKFSVIRLSRNNPDEQVLISCLMATAANHRQNNSTMAFAIFGRGRALPPLLDEQITLQKIKSICEFLVGDCSCEVKAMNPGHDLLISADWTKAHLPPEPQLDVLLTGLDTEPPAPKTATSPTQSNDITSNPSASISLSQISPTTSSIKKHNKLFIVIVITMAGIVSLAIAGTLWIMIRKKYYS